MIEPMAHSAFFGPFRSIVESVGGILLMAAKVKIAFIGSHSVRKTNAVHSFAGAVGRSGHSVEVGREVVRFNPLGLNEGATPKAQL